MNHNEVFLHGKMFQSIEEATEYHLKWRDSPIDLEEYRKFLDERFNEACMNAELNPAFTNRTAFLLLRMTTDWIEDKD